MTDEVTNALTIIKKACGSVVADLANHQTIQTAIATVETALTARLPQSATETLKDAPAAK